MVVHSSTPKNWVFKKVVSQPPVMIDNPDVKLRIFAVGYDRWAPGYLRLALPLSELRKAGLAETILWEEVKEGKTEDAINWANVIAFQKIHDPQIISELRLMQSQGKAIVMDFDDYLDKIYQTGDMHVASLWDEKTVIPQLHQVARSCDGITIASRGLEKRYKSINSNIFHLPNAIDSINLRWNFTFEKWPDKRFITMGWHGGSQHHPDLDLLAMVIPKIMQKYSNVAFKYIGMPVPEWVSNLPEDRTIICSRWVDLSEFGYDLADVDIGLIPLADNEFNKYGKSDLKFLDFTMAGACSVSSDVGELHSVITHKVNGLLVKDISLWESALSTLIEHPERIKPLSENAVDYLLKFRSIPVSIKRWYDAYRSIYLSRQAKCLRN